MHAMPVAVSCLKRHDVSTASSEQPHAVLVWRKTDSVAVRFGIVRTSEINNERFVELNLVVDLALLTIGPETLVLRWDRVGQAFF